MRYKQIYLNAPKDGLDLHLKLVEYFNFYNNHRQDEGFEYSNVAAGLAALVIEKATNQSFNEFTNEHILTPLGMSNSGWSFTEVDFSKHSKLYKDSNYTGCSLLIWFRHGSNSTPLLSRVSITDLITQKAF